MKHKAMQGLIFVHKGWQKGVMSLLLWFPSEIAVVEFHFPHPVTAT